MIFSHKIRSLVAGSAIAVCAALPAFAQTPLTALNTELRAYDTIENWQERPYRPAGLVEFVHVPGSIILDIRMVFDGPWTDELSRISVNSRDIDLILADGTEVSPAGGHPTWGQASLQSRSLTGIRPRDFPDEDRDLYWNGLFVVPKSTGSATLRFGGDVVFEAEVTVPTLSRAEDAASFATFTPTLVHRFRRVNLEDGRGDDAVSSSITAPPGSVLAEIEVEVAGVMSNQIDGDDRFTWHTHNFRLVDDAGQTMGLIGERFMRRILDSQFSGTDVGGTSDRTMIWVVPEALSEARLLFGETEVARVVLGAAPVTDTD